MMLKEAPTNETRQQDHERSFLVAYRNQLARELAEIERQLAGLATSPARIETFER